MKKLLMDKLNILRAMQGGVRDHRSTDSTPKHVPAKEMDTPKAIVEAAIEQGMSYDNKVNQSLKTYYQLLYYAVLFWLNKILRSGF